MDYVIQNAGEIHPILLAGIFHKQCVYSPLWMEWTVTRHKNVTCAYGIKRSLFSFENYYNANISKYFQMVGRLEIITILRPLILLVGLSILLMDLSIALRVQKLLPQIKVGSSLSLNHMML